MKTLKQQLPVRSFLLLFVAYLLTSPTFGQNTIPSDTVKNIEKGEIHQKRKSFKMTTLTFGGSGALFTRVNNQNTIMTGGRGSATFNHRYTIGGGGCGMTKNKIT